MQLNPFRALRNDFRDYGWWQSILAVLGVLVAAVIGVAAGLGLGLLGFAYL